MLQDPNVERYIEIAVKPLKKEIEKMKAQIEALNKALRIHDVVGRSEQLKCHCKKSTIYKNCLC
jgi:prefoldin subunit 5